MIWFLYKFYTKTFFTSKMERRIKKAFDLGKFLDLTHKRLMLIGYGCIGSTFLPLLLRHSNIQKSNILVIDKNTEPLKKVPSGIPTKNVEIKKKNFKKEILDFLRPGDILVDLAYYIKTMELLKLCNEHQIFFINTAVEFWCEEESLVTEDPRTLTLYDRQMKLQQAVSDFKNKTTGIITHGANPGWVSHFVKEALVDMVAYLAKQGKFTDTKLKQLVDWIQKEDFPRIAKELDVKVIHISEKDSQFAKTPKEPHVFRNTWSPTGFVEEGTAPSELGWGTHENPKIGYRYKTGPKNQIALSSRGINTWVKTWVPSGPLIGMIVRHEEAYSISKYLTIDGYRPTVHYAYLPCPDAVYSLNEIQNQIMINNKIPEFKEEILTDQITEGKDELGVLLFAKDITWWRGSLLDIVEARKLLPHQSATSVQVGISVLAGIYYMIKNPEEGVIHPECMHHLDVLEIIEAYLGPVVSVPVNWSPLDSVAVYEKMDEKNPYRFENFVVSYND
jgi:homospermidine synthase